ncbi:MAG: DUF4232 domain-containing protein [Acidimicrobiales bacterium]
MRLPNASRSGKIQYIAATLGVLLLTLALVFVGHTSRAQAAAVPTCKASQLEVAVGQGTNGNAGNLGVPFLIVNLGHAHCKLQGYPKFRFYSSAGILRRIIVTRLPDPQVYRKVQAVPIVLGPGRVASFGLTYSDVGTAPSGPPSRCLVQAASIALPIPQSQEYVLDLHINACLSNFGFGETAIQPTPMPKQA